MDSAFLSIYLMKSMPKIFTRKKITAGSLQVPFEILPWIPASTFSDINPLLIVNFAGKNPMGCTTHGSPLRWQLTDTG
jgi:hypothetical protein